MQRVLSLASEYIETPPGIVIRSKWVYDLGTSWEFGFSFAREKRPFSGIYYASFKVSKLETYWYEDEAEMGELIAYKITRAIYDNFRA